MTHAFDGLYEGIAVGKVKTRYVSYYLLDLQEAVSANVVCRAVRLSSPMHSGTGPCP